ncbi:hypothetical protein ASE61_15015 [Bosea sp. Root670]|nr:hypothetical protein ASE61_15015 [Bosea sp. Root670]
MDDANSSDGKKETKAGRKAFVPSDEQRATVRRMASERLGHPVIAAEIGISVPTLRKVFAEELRDRIAGGNLFAAAAEEIPPLQPVPPKAKRPGRGGRKSYRPADRDREKVAVLVAAGMTVDQIAHAMAITEPTLRKHYRAEIETGALRKRGELLMALNRAALKGNVAALRESLAIMDRANLEALQDEVRGTGKAETQAPAPAPASDALGKKVQADIDAHQVATDGDWADVIRLPQRVR